MRDRQAVYKTVFRKVSLRVYPRQSHIIITAIRIERLPAL